MSSYLCDDALVGQSLDKSEVFSSFQGIPMSLTEAPWAGLVWNQKKNTMLTAPENQKGAFSWLLWKCGDQFSNVEYPTEDDVREEVAGVMNIETGDLNW